MNEKKSFNKAKRQDLIFKKSDYIQVSAQRNGMIVLSNVFFSIKSTLEGLENKELTAKDIAELKYDILQLIEVAEPHMYSMSRFFEEN